ncbi:MAG: TonB C-terminal domain-containing protein [Mariprofundus sp.]|nr:TonB C-terminal domain-containing protein [Mariprofundus sp.]
MKYSKPQKRRFGLALSASIAVHLLLALWIGVNYSEKQLEQKNIPQIMDVVLLDEKKKVNKKTPKEAKTIANRNATGGSKQAADRMTRRAKAPLSGQHRQAKPAPPQQRLVKPPSPPVKQKRAAMIAKQGPAPDHRTKPRKKTKHVKKQKNIKPLKQVPISNLMPSAMALSQLSRDFQRERQMKQTLSREADIPINTKEAKYAPYAQSLVRALEEQWRPGQANYDKFGDNARRSLIKLTIDHNGDLVGVEILHPSPIAQINDSAVEAINAAAPFKVLPTSWGLDRVSFYLTFEVVEDRLVFHPM